MSTQDPAQRSFRPKRYGQPRLKWMLENRDEPFVARAYDKMMSLVQGMPLTSRDEVMRRLQDKRDEQFEGAMLELTTADVFSTNHPDARLSEHSEVIGASKPDFDVSVNEVCVAHAECTVLRTALAVVTDETAMVTDLIRKCGEHMRVPGFVFDVKRWTVGPDTPSASRLAKRFDDYLSTLVWEDCTEFSTQETEIKDEKSGWSIVVSAIRMRERNYLPDDRCGMIGTDMIAADDGEPLRKAVKMKLKQHETQSMPLIIVACCTDWWGETGKHAVCDLLLGRQVYKVLLGKTEAVVPVREGGGLYVDGASACDRLMGIITMSAGACLPWASEVRHTLWANPRFADHELIRDWRGPTVTLYSDSGVGVERNVPPDTRL